ncbi:hypothetical protein R6242_09525 [Iodobacter sp. CM08]|uniref:hypothetical protein n=1 Tax=Iodobacter sp. CM08 TaxID=3085902 RepID=UPI00298130F2|nr:hypothetical protein [Iodobacter sp. CM08]MDW5416803.1 hypothetical protein [Iodobacter sp. CM08]
MDILRIKDLTESGHYWWRAHLKQEWQILYIANPKRLTYGMAAFEFIGPIPTPTQNNQRQENADTAQANQKA